MAERNIDQFVSLSWARKVSTTFCENVLNTPRLKPENSGSDLALIRLVEEALLSAHWRTTVKTGRHTFPLGDNSRHIQDQQDDDYNGNGLHASPDSTGSSYDLVDEL